MIDQYLQWHFYDVPKGIVGAWKNFLWFNLRYFSVGSLLKTFFAPWRGYKEGYGRGLDIKLFLEAFAFNLISRVIGAVVRSFLIIVGLALEIFILVAGPFVLIVWLAWPLLLLVAFFLSYGLLAGRSLVDELSQNIKFFSVFPAKLILGLIVAAILFIFILIIRAFVRLKLRQPELKATISQALASPGQYNPVEFLTYEGRRAVQKASRQGEKLKIPVGAGSPSPYMSSDLLFYFLLKDNARLNFVFSRALLDIEEIKNNFIKNVRENVREDISDNFQELLWEALRLAEKKGCQRADVGDVLVVLSKNNPVFQKILIEANLKQEDIEELVNWLQGLEQKARQRKKFWTRENLCRMGSIGRQWAAGYTLTLDKYSYDLTETLKWTLPEIVGHQKTLEALEAILSRGETSNALLVGEPGTGRRSIIQALAVKSILGRSSPQINYKRIVQLELPSLLAAGGSRPQEVAGILDTIFKEVVKAGNVILVIDEFHNFVGIDKERPGAVDISGILSSYLRLPQFRLIVLTTFAGLHKNIEQNPGLLALFEKVEVSEISSQETFRLLQKAALALENIHKRMLSYPALREIISLSDKYIATLPFPKKAMDVLDAVFVYVSRSTKDKIVLPKHVAKIITEKTEIPVGELETKEKETLLNLEGLIHQRLINQEEAVKEVSEALRRARAGIATRKGPMGSFLFLGPTGVGKTETAKALAEIYFGSEERIVRLDMSEFQAIRDIPRLLGAAGEEGLLTTQIRERPFCLLLLDELEKAHSNILHLFLQVLDEGHLTDGQGRKVDFKNTLIISTSNAGFQIILQVIKEKTEWSGVKQKLLDYLFEKAIFRPEFINRFDAVVAFRPLTKENLIDVAQLMLEKLQKALKDKHIELVISENLKERVVELGYSPVFGARQMKRVLQDKIENPLARALLSGQLQRGSKVEIDPSNFSLKIK